METAPAGKGHSEVCNFDNSRFLGQEAGRVCRASRHRQAVHVPMLSCVRVCGNPLTVHMHILAHIYEHDLRDSANVPIPDAAVFSKVPPCALQRQEPLALGFMYFLLLPRFLVYIIPVAVYTPSSGSEGKLCQAEAPTIRPIGETSEVVFVLGARDLVVGGKATSAWGVKEWTSDGEKQRFTGSFKQPFP